MADMTLCISKCQVSARCRRHADSQAAYAWRQWQQPVSTWQPSLGSACPGFIDASRDKIKETGNG